MIRCDNGSEYISAAIQTWAQEMRSGLNIQPGNPQQNDCVERFNRAVRYDGRRSTVGMTWRQRCKTLQRSGCGFTAVTAQIWPLGGFTAKQRLTMAA